MHPAFSVIFFTTASGAGYGLLALIGLGAAAGMVPASVVFGLVGIGLALVLITAGLLSSTVHLGHPERAWRAFSQWRSSWLSREGVLSVVTYIPALVLAAGWFYLGADSGVVRVAGLLAAIGAVATVATTGMIYASLKPIADWANTYTVPVYLVFAIATGAVLLNAVTALTVAPRTGLAWGVIALLGFAWLLKGAAWRHNDGLVSRSSPNSATGLSGGAVHSIEWPHTAENYVLKEMGYRVARKHAARLRGISQILAFALPIAVLLTGIAVGGAVLPAAAAVIAVIVVAPGVLVERWLFFATAGHTATLYYGTYAHEA